RLARPCLWLWCQEVWPCLVIDVLFLESRRAQPFAKAPVASIVALREFVGGVHVLLNRVRVVSFHASLPPSLLLLWYLLLLLLPTDAPKPFLLVMLPHPPRPPQALHGFVNKRTD
ncbi:unnamed protein product, partial [Ectocarpus fasciculatus]